MYLLSVYRPMHLLMVLLLVGCLPAAEVVNANVSSAELAPELREQQPFKAVVTVRNPYDRAVRITKVDSSCTCTTLQLASHFLIPGEITTLTVEVSNIRRSGAQDIQVSLIVSDPDLEAIEVMCWWNVRPAIAVDAIPPGKLALDRPEDKAWRDVYRYVANERPDEPKRLRKRIRLWSPPGEVPPGGLRVERISYPGTLWKFTATEQPNGAILVLGVASDQVGPLPTGTFVEKVGLSTNHPDKPLIELHFETKIDPEAGRTAVDPMAPPGMPPLTAP